MRSTNTPQKKKVYLGLGFEVLVFVVLFSYRFILDRTDISSGKLTGPVFTKPITTNTPLSQKTKFSEPSLETLNPADQFAPHLLGNVAFIDGSNNLKLSEDDVAIGMADIFQDVMEYKDPPFTIFVIYGAADITVSLKNGGWDVWENTSEDFIKNQISEKILKVKEIYRNDFDVRGYRLIECYSQVSYCIVLETTKPGLR